MSAILYSHNKEGHPTRANFTVREGRRHSFLPLPWRWQPLSNDCMSREPDTVLSPWEGATHAPLQLCGKELHDHGAGQQQGLLQQEKPEPHQLTAQSDPCRGSLQDILDSFCSRTHMLCSVPWATAKEANKVWNPARAPFSRPVPWLEEGSSFELA